MISYTLVCQADGCGRSFQSWFQNSAAYDRLAAGSLLACEGCGSNEVSKALMVPAISSSTHSQVPPIPDTMKQPETRDREALRALRRKIEGNSENVGCNFSAEVRKMESGEAPRRSIHGEATPAETAKLQADGHPVIRIPWVPSEDA